MTSTNPTLLLLWIVAVSFIAGVAFAGAIVWLETRKWRSRERIWIGVDPGRDDGCAVYGHYDANGVLHIDRVEFDRDQRA